jgi:Ca2+-binding EF-hand superfamily protein
MDRDSDGKISRDEAPEEMKQRFATLDTNGDGFISRDELPAISR